ncbi:Spy/CpxP family protein refolding chaperone [Pannus brasiliensis CCIBt3594]|uniref:Spy/CpxP family protein refolding chaperone n=1 Tax=Pannus brasiliensis CCIBt3594 TaxID=1427578 RepID=A0AAW9QLQ8_9CHRO
MSIFPILSTAMALTVGTTVLFTHNVTATPKPDLTIAQATSEPSPQGRPRRVRGEDNLLEQLNLSDSQKRQIAAIRQKYQGQMRQLREAMKSDRQEMETLMTGNASDNELRAKHQEIQQNQQRLGDLRFQSLLETRKVLTPAQRTQFAQLMQQRRSEFREREGQGPRDE